jgi:arabinogalactan endo-1,4-beta-galactosidase
MKHLLFFVAMIIFLSACKEKAEPTPSEEDEFIRGADFSFLPEIRDYGILFYNSIGEAEDALDIMKNAGCNMIRIRIWHDPAEGHSGLQEVIDLANEVRSKGMKVWLCVHFSDSWADPGKQNTPHKWTGLDLPTMKDSVYQYTKMITHKIKPDLIQVGNEINHGFLWETGRLTNGDNFYLLVKEGARAVREVSPGCRIMIHYAGTSGVEGFFQQVGLQQVDYDYIGLSYYPIWHGKNLDALSQIITKLGSANNKKVFIAETAYPWTFGWKDWTTNIIGSDDQILSEYPATPQGQKDFMQRIRTMMENNEFGLGFCYWGGEFIAYKGDQATDGSSWENQALFDFDTKALPALEVFEK